MIEAMREALSFVKDQSREDLDRNRQLALSLTKEMEIIGEAANKVTPAFRKKHPDIPWGIIVRTRNRLIHGYFDINLDIIWNTVKEELPRLLKQLEKIMSPTSV